MESTQLSLIVIIPLCLAECDFAIMAYCNFEQDTLILQYVLALTSLRSLVQASLSSGVMLFLPYPLRALHLWLRVQALVLACLGLTPGSVAYNLHGLGRHLSLSLSHFSYL